jgi:hypothetical protein
VQGQGQDEPGQPGRWTLLLYHEIEKNRIRPLEDIRLLAIEPYGAGPFGTLHLADMGADIIKIEV